MSQLLGMLSQARYKSRQPPELGLSSDLHPPRHARTHTGVEINIYARPCAPPIGFMGYASFEIADPTGTPAGSGGVDRWAQCIPQRQKSGCETCPHKASCVRVPRAGGFGADDCAVDANGYQCRYPNKWYCGVHSASKRPGLSHCQNVSIELHNGCRMNESHGSTSRRPLKPPFPSLRYGAWSFSSGLSVDRLCVTSPRRSPSFATNSFLLPIANPRRLLSWLATCCPHYSPTQM